jgi:hypothetical protein
MSGNGSITISLFLCGFIPCSLLGGLGEYGDHHALPWLVGFGTQAGVVLGMIAQRRGWWRRA